MTHYNIVKVNNWCVISPTPPVDGMLSKTIDKYMTYTVPGKHFFARPEWAEKHLFKSFRGIYPAGLSYIVKAIFTKYCQQTVNNTFSMPDYSKKLTEEEWKSISDTLDPKLRYYQKEAIRALIEKHGGILSIDTGGGKTFTIIEYLKHMNMKALVMCPTRDIKNQWQKYNLPNVEISTYQNPRIRSKDYIHSFRIIVVDEAHLAPCASIYKVVMKCRTDCILVGVSATANIKRESGDELKIFAALGPIIYTKTRKELIAEGFIADATAYYLKPKFSSNGKFMDYPQVYNKEIINNDDRNNLIVDTALKEWKLGSKTLILVSQLDHGEILIKKFLTKEIESKRPINENSPNIVFMNGKSKKRNRDMNVYDIIIATSIYDMGYDLPTLDCLILGSAGKSAIKVIQRCGRVLRLKSDGRASKIYDFIDSGVKYLTPQYKKRRIILEKDFSIVELERNQATLL